MSHWLNNLPIRVKAFAASGVLLICLVGLVASAFVTLNHSAQGLNRLFTTVLPEQRRLFSLQDRANAIELNIFRYVAWSNNGVNGRLLNDLHQEISAGLSAISQELRRLADDGPDATRELVGAWQQFARTALQTIEIARADPPMGTMMLGGADDDFRRLAAGLLAASEAVSQRSHLATEALVHEAAQSKRVAAIGGVLGVLISLAVTVLAARSILNPIQAVTLAMKRVALGDTLSELGSKGRRDEIGQMLEAICSFRAKLERDNLLLNRQEEELRLQNTRFNAALNNMTYGLAMFDKHRNLIVCNRRYAEIYRLPYEAIQPGAAQQQYLDANVAAGLKPDPAALPQLEPELNVSGTKLSISHLELSDGRSVLVTNQPMADGGWVSTHEDITERRRIEAQIEHMARHDALTDLPNRVLFRERLDQALANSRRHDTIAVLCLDLDHFKQVNDTLGHLVGDMLLKGVSTRLRSCVAESDTVARLSGDEFAIIHLTMDNAESVATLAQRIIEVIGMPFDLDGHHVVIGSSIGISLGPADASDADRLLKSADTALYRAKSEGRSTYRFFETAMDDRLQARRAMELALRAALPSSQLELYYQPLVRIRDKQITGFEALLRWNHPDRGLLSAAEFIPLAEEIGLIAPISEWVLREACASAARWPDRCKVAINISAAQFRNRNLVTVVLSALSSSGISANRLELEITESVLLENSAAVSTTLNQLHALGVRMSMDDFGTGYSSLSYLQKFPFNKIKIDASFTRGLGASQESIAIVRAIVGLGKSLGMTITAEGVETREQLDFITAEGCEEVQGHYFSPPRPAKEIETFISEFRQRIAA